MTATEIRTAARQMVQAGTAPTLAAATGILLNAEAALAAATWRAGLPAQDR
ncbi:hypothetical protein OOK41_08965 [Micromonospora sp. NBC_01655]|uniref:hypothetical protein n=1 Tax=Micromonospora sp. NBC_01655 TaxID=2975983 RepID=UPI002250A8C8|nr:hypothetical protein [Micromonospora sp. NBC_01655]MCX4470435.1 hypothetical protein [Micromonospora sp. NBC_01655]